MAQQTLTTNVVLNGTVTAGFSQVADKVTAMGAIISQVSGQVSEWLGESKDTYRDYETIMNEVHQNMAQRYGEMGYSANQLERDFGKLEGHVQEWAASTIFHVSDVSEAVLNATRAGWEYDEILAGFPAVMNLAQAGGMDLAEATEFLAAIMNATGTEFEDSTEFINQWVYAANHAPTTVEEMGEAMERMGATMRFTDSNEELLTLLGILAKTGATGQTAGTLLRNAMIRLIAPTGTAAKALSGLSTDYAQLAEELGLEDENAAKAWLVTQNAKLDTVAKQLGVTKEKLIEMLQEEGLYEEDDAYAADLMQRLGFSAYDAKGQLKPMIQIFGELHDALYAVDKDGQALFTEQDRNSILKTVFGVRSITAAQGLMAMLDETGELFAGISENSGGYAENMAKARTSGLYGKEELFLSKWEEFSRKIGEIVADPLGVAYGYASDFLDVLNGMDEESLSALAGAAAGLAAAGPGLIIAGLGMKLLADPIGRIALVAALAAAGIGALIAYTNTFNENQFQGKFGAMAVDVDALRLNVEAVSSQFDIERQAFIDWMNAVDGAQETYQNALFTFNEQLLKEVLVGGDFTEEDYNKFYGLGGSVVKAVQDGITSGANRDANILRALLGNDYHHEGEEGLETAAEGLLDYRYAALYQEAFEIGENIRDQLTAALANGELTEQDREAIQAQVDRLNQIQTEISNGLAQEAYGSMLYKASRVSWDSASSFVTQNNAALTDAMGRIDQVYESLAGRLWSAWTFAQENGGAAGPITYTGTDGQEHTIDISGMSWEEIAGWVAAEQESAKQSERNKYLEPSLAMIDALLADSEYSDAWKIGREYLRQGGVTDDVLGMMFGFAQNGGKNLTGQVAGRIRALFGDNLPDQLNDVLNFLVNPQGIFGTDGGLMPEKYLEQIIAGRDPRDYPEWYKQYLIDQQQAEVDKWQAKLDKSSPGAFGYGTTEMYLTDAQQKLAELMQELYGGETVPVDLDTTQADAWLDETKTVNATLALTGGSYWNGGRGTGIGSGAGGGLGVGNDFALYAGGGRATSASIFGEAGAEWAIPEEHSLRTASLLNAARAASGFSWGELLDMSGGLSGGGVSVNIGAYAPVIHAGNADGVADELMRDKRRLADTVRDAVHRALREIRVRDGAAAYA